MRELEIGDEIWVRATYIGEFWREEAQANAALVRLGPVRVLQWPPDDIVPASAVPTEEQRAAVGRLVDFADSRVDIDGDEEETFHRMDATREAVQPGDIEAARAVAEGGTNG